MRRSTLLLAGLAAVASAQQTTSPYILDDSLADTAYPYAIHLPSNNQDTLPPAVLMLGGKGSMFEQGVTFPVDSTISYGGIGWRISQYFNGTRTPDSTLAAEEFLSIIPYIYLWNADAAGEANYTVENIMAVVNDAATKYPFDPNRLYVSGYSMGARAIWPLLIAQPTTFAAASICAGVPVPIDTSNLSGITQIPLRIYTGTLDYDAFSQQYQAQAYYQALQADGSTVAELVTLQGVDHNDMQQTPYDADMFYWFLNQTLAGSNDAPALVQNPSASASYASVQSAYNVYASVNSYSYYRDGFPSSLKPPAPSTTAAASGTVVVANDQSQSTELPASAVIQNARSSALVTAPLSALATLLAGAAWALFTI